MLRKAHSHNAVTLSLLEDFELVVAASGKAFQKLSCGQPLRVVWKTHHMARLPGVAAAPGERSETPVAQNDSPVAGLPECAPEGPSASRALPQGCCTWIEMQLQVLHGRPLEGAMVQVLHCRLQETGQSWRALGRLIRRQNALAPGRTVRSGLLWSCSPVRGCGKLPVVSNWTCAPLK